jgi:ketosteroid isomerase-like protein
MRKILTLLLAVAVLAFAVLIQGRARASDEETQIIQLERSWNQAEMGRDAGAMASLVDDTLVYVDYDGSIMNRKEYLRSVANPAASPDHIYDEGMKVHVYSNAGVVSGVYRETGVTKGKPYTRRARFTDTWIKQSGQWKCVASQSTLIQ